MRALKVPPFRFDLFPPRSVELDKRVGAPSPATPPQADLGEEPVCDWESLWIDLGGEG
jgi:hypothetical protein